MFHMNPKAPQLAVIMLNPLRSPAQTSIQSLPMSFAEFSATDLGSIFSNFMRKIFNPPNALSTKSARRESRKPAAGKKNPAARRPRSR